MTNNSDLNTRLTAQALVRTVQEREPAAFFMPLWLVQRLISLDCGPLGVLGNPRVPAWTISRDRVLQLAQENDLVLDEPPPLPQLILLAHPEPELLEIVSPPLELLRYWRLLFHARARGAVLASLGGEVQPMLAVHRRIERLGPGVFNEARFVLQKDRYLPATADDLNTYAHFAALFLELVYFYPDSVKAFFPSISDPRSVVRLLQHDVDGERLLESSHLPGAAGPVILPEVVPPPATSSITRRQRKSRRDSRRGDSLLGRARDADARGNDVRAAILRMRVCRGGGDNIAGTYAEALRDIDQLVGRLQAAVGFDDATSRRWRSWLAELLENAAGGWWNAEGRLLYDLQKVCTYHERELFSVGVVEWLLEFCRRPLRRPQPDLRSVLMLKALRTALRRAGRVRLIGSGRAELQHLIRGAIETMEEQLRHRLRPRVDAALDAARIAPRDPTEITARQKLCDELVETAAERGYLSFSQVRDAISRSQLKLDDLTQARELIGGDQLLRLDNELGTRLDAVYRHGEVYLRFFHRVSSLLFATRVGRLLTRGLLLPLGGAFIVLEALDHSLGKLIIYLTKTKPPAALAKMATENLSPSTTATAEAAARAHVTIFNQWWLLILMGLFLFGLINSPAFRAAVAKGLTRVGKGLRTVFVDFPKWIANRPLVRLIFNSRIMRLVGRFLLKPALVAGFVWLFVPDRVDDRIELLIAVSAFVAGNVFLNSRFGRAVEQAVVHTVRTTVARLGWEVLVTLGRGIVEVFERLLEMIDRLLYAVDELLRFRAGQGRLALIVKAVLGVFWFYIAYITRFAINLLIEPQVNPIKHFPVVTVSHKLLLPTIKPLGDALTTVGVAGATAYTAATAIVTSIPGIFGFLAWELKENWRLYRANRSQVLRKLPMGSHGETLAQLLRPGFHSGTIPKLFHKLRKASLAGSPKVERHVQGLEHVEHAVRLFVQYELIAPLNRHPLFAGRPIELVDVSIGVTHVRADLRRPAPADSEGAPTSHTVLLFEQRGGWVVGSIAEPGFIAELEPRHANLFAAALLGFYQMSGVDLVVEQLQRAWAPVAINFDLRGMSLVVWPADNASLQVRYDLASSSPLLSPLDGSTSPVPFPTLDKKHFLLAATQVSRREWLELWQTPSGPNVAPVVQVLPQAPELMEARSQPMDCSLL